TGAQGTSGSFGWWRPTRAGSRGSARRSRPSQSGIAVGGRRSLGSRWPAISPSAGRFPRSAGTLRIGDRLRVLRLLAAGFVVAPVLGILWAQNARSGITALGQ